MPLLVNSFLCESDADSIPYIYFTNSLASAGEDFVLCPGSVAELHATGGIQYLWSPAADVSDATLYNPTIQPFSSSTYAVEITDIFGCVILDSVFVEILEGDDCPKTYTAFSPNNDGVNDVWIIDGIEGVYNNQVVLYNRWGDVIRTFDNYDNLSTVWMGEDVNNDELPSGTYFFTIHSNGERLRSGWVQLVK
jgi:gliding motility-associated-like protein